MVVRERVQASQRYRWWALVVLLLGFFSTGISVTLLTAVLPTIAREFHVGTNTVAWVVTGPMLVYGVLMPSMGKAGDLYGRKRVYLLGWALSMAFSGLAACRVERRFADRVPAAVRRGRRGDRARRRWR